MHFICISLEFQKEIEYFDHININKFSPRKGTKAFEMEDNVPETVKVNRCQLFRRFMMMRKKEKMYQAVIKSVLSK